MTRLFTDLAQAIQRRLPPRKGVYSFRHEFAAFRRRLAAWEAIPRKASQRGRVGILFTPWLETPVPLFSLEIALALRSEGWDPVFLCDFSQLAFNEVAPHVLSTLESFARELPRFGEVILVAKEVATTTGTLPGDLDRLIQENAIWKTKGEELAADFVEEQPGLHASYAAHASRVAGALARAAVDWLLLPGGVFGVSGLYLRAATALGLDFTTYDSGPGRLFAAHRGIAAHSADIPVAHALLRKDLATRSGLRPKIHAIVEETVRDRQELRDPFKFQAVAPTGRTDFSSDLLVCLNYRADTAALFRTRAFGSIKEWVLAVLDYAERRGNLRVNIRPHPVTRQAHVRSTDRLEEAVKQRDPEGRFSRWVAADAPISSYDLLNTTRIVLPFTSTVGIESALLGKPVIVGSHVYYESLGFVHAAGDPENYFALIDRALNGDLASDETSREQAALALYLMLKCRTVYTAFTPQPPDFLRWSKEAPGDLWARPEMEDLRTALSTRQCLAWLRHRRLWSDYAN